MDTLTIEGIPTYNGEYPLDMSYFSNRELHFIKEVTQTKNSPGIRAGELQEAFTAGDNDLMVALAGIAIWRKTKVQPNMEPLWEAEAGKFTFEVEAPPDEEDDDGPPESEPDESGNKPENSQLVGETSNGHSDLPASVLSRTGAQG
jgi:hypothetical protein